MSAPVPILIFDMDGVLLQPRAYHLALRENVAFWAGHLGYQGVDFSQEEVHAFESAGITAEWISGSLCAALMLEQLWQLDPSANIPPDELLSPVPVHGLARPDFKAAAESVGRLDRSLTQEERCAAYIQEQAYEQQIAERLIELLQGARHIRLSAVHRLQQELVLGSQNMQPIYGLEPWWDHPGYLQSIDQPFLDRAAVGRLLAWKQAGKIQIALMTNRPSTPPDGFFDTPETEYGLDLIGMQAIAAAGAGVMGWLADRHGMSTNAFLKPSPVHALTALRLALGDPLDAAAEQALALLEHPDENGIWEMLHERPVYIFEDTSPGFLSIQRASRHLSSIGVDLDLHLIGIAEDRVKAEALSSQGANVYAHILPALEDLGLL